MHLQLSARAARVVRLAVASAALYPASACTLLGVDPVPCTVDEDCPLPQGCAVAAGHCVDPVVVCGGKVTVPGGTAFDVVVGLDVREDPSARCFASVGAALGSLGDGEAARVFLATGDYDDHTETFPMHVPNGVTLVGDKKARPRFRLGDDPGGALLLIDGDATFIHIDIGDGTQEPPFLLDLNTAGAVTLDDVVCAGDVIMLNADTFAGALTITGSTFTGGADASALHITLENGTVDVAHSAFDQAPVDLDGVADHASSFSAVDYAVGGGGAFRWGVAGAGVSIDGLHATQAQLAAPCDNAALAVAGIVQLRNSTFVDVPCPRAVQVDATTAPTGVDLGTRASAGGNRFRVVADDLDVGPGVDVTAVGNAWSNDFACDGMFIGPGSRVTIDDGIICQQ